MTELFKGMEALYWQNDAFRLAIMVLCACGKMFNRVCIVSLMTLERDRRKLEFALRVIPISQKFKGQHQCKFFRKSIFFGLKFSLNLVEYEAKVFIHENFFKVKTFLRAVGGLFR